MFSAFRTALGVARSLRTYYGDRSRHAAMDRLHAGLVRPGDLVFDIGSHVGDRVASFRRLNCRVVALEPQPALVRVLRLIHGRDPGVAIVAAAVGRASGTLSLKVNRANPTISTGSQAFINSAAGAPGWEGQTWDATVEVAMLTLDQLIARHGVPAFTKIDVEGFEAEALMGLSKALPALSFEFTTIQRDVALAVISRLEALGHYQFDASLGESQQMLFRDAPLDAGQMAAWINGLPHEANSGDVYASLVE